ncbi:unnamed protein product [Rotaria sp. Silwood1]|nr:unnamed protein product [Rotaria sp. Silwood1]CAF4931434.1 unnamed protein product [Rotaria sp. Silwood1]CAF5010479.1 unnamed protein product [Rotaria sp. Silwood1]
MNIFLLIILVFTFLSSTSDVDAAMIDSSSNTFIDAQYFHYRSILKPYYTVDPYGFNGTIEYFKIPDLQFTFNHSTPLLYELQFQGSCSSLIKNAQTLIQFRYDNRWVTNSLELWSPIEGFLTLCHKYARVYLPAGFHTIDFEVRTTGRIIIYFGELYIKLTQFNPNSQTNLQLLDLK